jgi:putative transcriptional regulator
MQNKVLNNCVQLYRQELAITQADLADQVGVTRQTIIAIEKGNYEPSVRLALKLSSILKVPVEKLFYEDKV